jgi:hypothetical protein
MSEQRETPGRSPRLGGNQRLMLFAVVIAAVLFVGVLGWTFLANPLGRAPGGVDQASEPDLTTIPGGQVQRAGESTVGKNDPARQSGPAGERQRAIKATARPLSLTDDQRRQASSVLQGRSDLARVDQARFELMIGTLVPEQITTGDIPPEITEIMHGYWGDQCIVVANQLVIVDQHTRRIVALVPLAA